jgi:hypothetical protein
MARPAEEAAWKRGEEDARKRRRCGKAKKRSTRIVRMSDTSKVYYSSQ